MRHLDGCAAQLLPGAPNQPLQLLLIFFGQLTDCLMPECRFDMVAQIGILTEVFVIERQGIPEALANRRGERVLAPPRSHPWLDLHQSQRTRHFQLLAQGCHANAKLTA